MNYTATQIAKKLDISRSYLYYLKENGLIEIELNEKGRPMWTEEVYDRLKEYIKKNNVEEKPEVQELPYKTTKINNRRYLGNKYKLLPFITEVIEKECENVNTVADIFAGTGAVASAFTDRKIITNDIMYSNYICHVAWFSSEDYSEDKIIDLMANHIATSDSDLCEYLDITTKCKYYAGDNGKTCDNCIKQYFENKAKELLNK